MSPCRLHLTADLRIFQSVGVVDRLDPRFGEHAIIVVFPTIHTPPFGSAWVDAFRADELVTVDAGGTPMTEGPEPA